MILPITHMAIKGAVWYQGESDCNPTQGPKYNCTFASMLQDWRETWHTNSLGSTATDFPFGFVQLSTWGKAPQDGKPLPATQEDLTVATVRWGQTANYGYVPNPILKNVFMSVAVDLGSHIGGCGADFFPNLCIHPCFKQEVGRRLALGARAVAYGETGVYFQGPIPDKVVSASSSNRQLLLPPAPQPPAPALALAVRSDIVSGTTGIAIADDIKAPMASLVIHFRNVGASGIEIRDKTLGWELLVGSKWMDARVTSSTSVTVTIEGGAGAASAVRYLWKQAPCGVPHFEQGNCSVYAAAENLPAAPFLMEVPSAV
jgi:hypothetical protein